MKAQQLIDILSRYPDAEVKIGFAETVIYSELTDGSEDRIEPARAVYAHRNEFIVSTEVYMSLADSHERILQSDD